MDEDNKREYRHPQRPVMIYILGFLLGPIAAGILGYKTLNALGRNLSAKVVIRWTVIFSIITYILSYIASLSGEKYIQSLMNLFGVMFAITVVKVQNKALNEWKLNNPEENYASIFSSILWGLLGFLIYTIPIIIILIYQYLHPCPSGYTLIGNLCFPL